MVGVIETNGQGVPSGPSETSVIKVQPRQFKLHSVIGCCSTVFCCIAAFLMDMNSVAGLQKQHHEFIIRATGMDVGGIAGDGLNFFC